jgi:uncharacterized glyoxalase superfamily protein PhnB
MISPVLQVNDVSVSMDYYSQKLGFTAEGTLPGPDGKPGFGMVLYDGSSIMFNAWYDMDRRDVPRGVGVEIYIKVADSADIDAIYAKIKGSGATIAKEIHDTLWGDRMFYVKDPDGYSLNFAKTVRQMSDEEMATAAQNANGANKG